jgi:glycosyltransferase involved in cell wall biosynthesis
LPAQLLFYRFGFARLLRKLGIDAVLNLADIPIPVDVRQVYVFDWAFAVYPESVAWQRMSVRDRCFKRIKLAVLRSFIQRPTVVAAQTPGIEKRLREMYGLASTVTVPNAVDLPHDEGAVAVETLNDFSVGPQGPRLLYLTRYYPHKNLEILLEVGRRVRDRELPFRFIVTLDASQGAGARAFLRQIVEMNLSRVICNIGPVHGKQIRALFAAVDGLIMPTLLESFSGSYVEAMAFEKPIFTSQYDFAQDVCGDAAFYFDPLDAESILSTLGVGFSDPLKLRSKVVAGLERMSAFPTWPEAFQLYRQLLEGGSLNAADRGEVRAVS